MSAPQYRPEIDGLRSIAVLSVMIFHINASWLQGGFLGVDIFFVISGFLITLIIKRELENGTFSVANFYERRIRRILPALFFVIIVCLPVAWILMSPGQLKNFSQSIVATVLFSSNIYFYLKTGYFEASSEELPFLHTWSLAVEEQYYIIFPVLMSLVFYYRAALIKPVVWALFALSLFYCVTTAYDAPMAGFFLLPSRAWEILAGSLLAMYYYQTADWLSARARIRTGLEVTALVLIVASLLLVDGNEMLSGWRAVPVVFGTVLLIGSMTQSSMLGRVFASPLPVGVGLVSYSAYLWHQPLYAFARVYHGTPPLVLMCGLFFLSFLLAWVSWRYIERPFRNRAWMSRNTVLIGGAAAISVMAVLGVMGHLKAGFPARFDADTRALALTASISPKRGECHTDGTEYRAPSDGCVYGDGDPTWAVFGDSHGVELAYALGETDRSVMHLTFSGCPPALAFDLANPGCHAWVKDAVDTLEKHPTVKSVLVVYRHGFHLSGEHTSHAASRPNFLKDLSADAARQAYWDNLQVIVTRLQNAGKTVYLVDPTPELPNHIERLIYDKRTPIADRATMIGTTEAAYVKRHGDTFERLRSLGAHNVPMKPFLCAEGGCRATEEGKALYFDNNHLSLTGARLLLPRLIDAGYLSQGAQQ